MKRIIFFCFYVPFIFKALNAQAFLTKFTPAPEVVIQAFAYFTVCLVIFGIFVIKPQWKTLPALNRLWLVFYFTYFPIALLANLIQETEPHRLLVAFIPVVFFVGFTFLLQREEERERFCNIMAGTFLIVSLLTIVFDYYNISVDFEGVYEFRLERAGGVYGDANNAALASEVAFVLIYYTYKPNTRLKRIFKVVALIITLFATIITYSKTGLLVLVVIGILALIKKISFEKIFLSLLLLPIAVFLGIQYAVNANLISQNQLERIYTIIDLVTFNTTNVDYSSRDVLLQNMLNYIYESPIIGNGVQFSNLIRGHNTIIGVWADAGIFVFLIFIALLVAYFRKALSASGPNRLMILSLLIILTTYMLTLQTVINQAYLIALFAFIGYVVINPLPSMTDRVNKLEDLDSL